MTLLIVFLAGSWQWLQALSLETIDFMVAVTDASYIYLYIVYDLNHTVLLNVYLQTSLFRFDAQYWRRKKGWAAIS